MAKKLKQAEVPNGEAKRVKLTRKQVLKRMEDFPKREEAFVAGIQTGKDRARWREYPCDDYFEDGWARRGHFDKHSQTLVIVPLKEAYENTEVEFFAVGRSGWGGIDFGYRKGHQGLWAYYPIDRDFKFMAPTVAELVEAWCCGRLCV